MKSSLKTKIWLYVIIMSCTRFWVNLHLTVAWMSRDSLLETGAKFKWLQWNSKIVIHLRTKWLWVRTPLLSHKKYEKIYRSMADIILWYIEHYFFSIVSKIMTLLSWTEKNNTLEAFTGVSFFHVYENCFVNFV